MTVKNYKKYLALSRVFNKTYGAISSQKSSTETVTVRLVDDEMVTASFIIIVSYPSEDLWRELRKRWIEEGVEKITDTFKKASVEYKEIVKDDSAVSDKTVKFEINQATISDGLEFLNYKTGIKRTAIFRLMLTAKVI